METSSESLASIHGPMCALLLPSHLDHQHVGRALLAWDFKLSHKEVETVEYMVNGATTNSELARKLNLDDQTVKYRVQAILDKMKVRSRTQAAVIAALYGLGNEVLKKNGYHRSRRDT